MTDLIQTFDLTNPWALLRIVCGAFLIPHLFVKFRNQDFVQQYMRDAGLKPPKLWLYLAFLIEIVTSIGLILNAGMPYVAYLAAAFLAVASYASWRVSAGKWMWNFGGAEYPLFWAIVCVAVGMQAG